MDSDGCSSFCLIQSGYTCTGSPSICVIVPPAPIYQDQLTIDVVYIDKIDNVNEIEIVLAIGPANLPVWNQV